MAGGNVADYWASFTVKTDKTALARVDRYLSVLSQKLEKYQKQFNKRLGFEALFKVNEKQLVKTLGDALDKSSKSVAFEISKFVINDRNLQAALLKANRAITIPSGGYVSNGMLSPKEWDRRRDLSNKDREEERAFRKEMLQLQRQDRLDRTRETRSRRNNRYFDFGVPIPSTNHFMRFGMASIPFIGGAIGLSSLNQANQESISNRLTTQAVLQSQGFSEQQGTQAFSWLRNLANENGFNYMQAAPDYNQFLANALGADLSIGKSQDIFKGFTEYATAVGATGVKRQRANNALSQMLGKGTVSMEELRQQLAEALPGATDIFAEAFAQQTKSGLTGQKAVQALYEAIPKGKVKSADILPIVAEIMSQRAQPKLGVLRQSSIAEQGRMGNATSDLLNTFSTNGGESGFARFFRTMTTAFKESDRLVKSMARGFDEMSKYAEVILLLPQSIQRMFEGRDSWFADKFFPDPEKRQAILDWASDLKSAMNEMSIFASNVYDGWSKLLGLMDASPSMKNMSVVANAFGTVNSLVAQDYVTAKERAKSAGKDYLDVVTSIPRILPDMITGGKFSKFLGFGETDEDRSRREAVQISADPKSPMYKDFNGALDFIKSKNESLQYEKPVPESALPSNGIPEASNNKTIDVQVKAQIDVSGAQNPEEVSKMLDDKLASTWRDALIQFGNYT